MNDATTIKHHLVIAGTGRAGTSLLVRVLTACGLDTELSRDPKAFWNDAANAGLETAVVLPGDHPYVVKSPWTYQFIDELLQRPSIKVDGLILPLRDLREAAASRIIVELCNIHDGPMRELVDSIDRTFNDSAAVKGGVTYSLEPLDQARILAHSLHAILERALDHDIPICLLKFPRFTTDLEYLFRNLRPFLPAGIDFERFCALAGPLIDPEQVRVTRELSSARVEDGAGAHSRQPTDGIPSLETLDNIALKRELTRIRKRAEELIAQRQHVIDVHGALSTAYKALQAEMKTLAAAHASLATQLESVTAERNRLAATNASLQNK